MWTRYGIVWDDTSYDITHVWRYYTVHKCPITFVDNIWNGLRWHVIRHNPCLEVLHCTNVSHYFFWTRYELVLDDTSCDINHVWRYYTEQKCPITYVDDTWNSLRWHVIRHNPCLEVYYTVHKCPITFVDDRWNVWDDTSYDITLVWRYYTVQKCPITFVDDRWNGLRWHVIRHNPCLEVLLCTNVTHYFYWQDMKWFEMTHHTTLPMFGGLTRYKVSHYFCGQHMVWFEMTRHAT